MARVADLVKRINQGALLVRFKCDVEVDGCTDCWVAQTFPIVWNGIPGMFHTHVMPSNWGRCEDGEGRCAEKAEYGVPVISHGYRSLRTTEVRFSRLEVQRPKHRIGASWQSADWERQSLYDAFQCQN